jgi:sterol desaturase/sphingolipid hydroxylase (fatty acid hydroxylase superfamily)
VWKIFKQRLAPYKLDSRPLDVSQIRREIGWSLSTIIVFSIVAVNILWLRKSGYTKMYENVNDHGVLYLVLSVIFMLMVKEMYFSRPLILRFFLQIHDLYFYIIHRAMHTPLL